MVVTIIYEYVEKNACYSAICDNQDARNPFKTTNYRKELYAAVRDFQNNLNFK